MKNIKREIKSEKSNCMDSLADVIRSVRRLMILSDKINNQDLVDEFYKINRELEYYYERIRVTNPDSITLEESYIFENNEESLSYKTFIEDYVEPYFIDYSEEIKVAFKNLNRRYPLDDIVVELIHNAFSDFCVDNDLDENTDIFDVWGEDIEDIFYDGVKALENKNYKGNKLNESYNNIIDEVSTYILNHYENISELSTNEICNIIFKTYEDIYGEGFEKDNKTLLRDIINNIYNLQVG